MITAKDDPQLLLEEVAEREASVWTEHAAIEGQMFMAQVLVQDLQVFQNQRTKACYGVDPDFLRLLESSVAERGSAVLLDGGRMMWLGNESRLVLPCTRPSRWESQKDGWIKHAWEVLESVALRKE